MRILYLDAFAVPINPTAGLAPELIARTAGTVTSFGPGLSSAADLELGALAIAEREGPFDAVVVGPGIPVLGEGEGAVAGAADHLLRFASFAARRDVLERGLADILGALGRIEAPIKALWLMNFDYYAATARQIETLDRLGLVVLGPNAQFITRLDELPGYAADERHYIRKRDRFSDSFLEWTLRNPARVIPLPHFVAETEFCARSLAGRHYDLAVPGVEYVLRRRAIASLGGRALKLAPKRVFHAFRLAGRLGLRPFASYLGLRGYQAGFQASLFDSRMVFTARGGFGIPIRKFFEIPASGALMLCVPPVGFAALGFAPGRTHVECRPEEIADAVADLDRRPEEAERIAASGRALVRDAHSLAARAVQLRAAFEAMLRGTYHGAVWDEGRLVPLRGAA